MLKKFRLENHTLFLMMVPIILIKFMIVRSLLFEEADILHTILVELGYLLVLFGLIEYISSTKVKKVLYISLNAILSLILIAILLYHDYFGYIVTIKAFSQLGQVGTIKDSVFQLINPIYLTLFVDFVLLAVYAIFRKKGNTSSDTNDTKENKTFVTAVVLIGLIAVGTNIYLQKDAEIADTVLAAEKQGILTYEILATHNIVQAENEPTLKNEEMAQLPEKIQELKGITPLPEDQLTYHGIGKDKNIIVVQMEAFQNFAINLKVNGQEVTPFLNDLIDDSLYFDNFYQQIGPGNTSDAEFMSNTSLYPSAWEPTSESFGDRVIPSFPKLLKEEGYKTLTFHANDLTFWNRDHLYPALGFDKYYDINFFGKNDVIGIGPSDEYVYERALPELKKLYEKNQKFYAQIVTLSSHHPFKIPADKDVLELPDELKGSIVGDYLQSLNYTDRALGEFVQMLKDEGMWEDTILVAYGDHFGLQPSGLQESDFPLLKQLVGHDYTFLDQFNIPLFISIGGEDIQHTYDNIGGQLDIMPTVANLLGLSLDNFVHFGQDIINYQDNLFGMRYYMPVGSFFNNEIAFKTAEGFDDGEAFNVETGEPIQDITQYKEDYDRIMELLNLSDSYLKSLPYQ